jgi:hypothetical protein
VIHRDANRFKSSNTGQNVDIKPRKTEICSSHPEERKRERDSECITLQQAWQQWEKLLVQKVMATPANRPEQCTQQ